MATWSSTLISLSIPVHLSTRKPELSHFSITEMIRVKRINDEDVKPVTFIDVVEDKRPIRGADVFPEIYANIFSVPAKSLVKLQPSTTPSKPVPRGKQE